MAWGNLEVESVELVQDMSYEKLKERLDRALQKGNNEAKEELCRNFDIAVRAVEKKRSNINECIIQCDESFRILLSNLFLAFDIVKVKLGYITLENDLLEEICIECKKNMHERNLQKMAGKCCEIVEKKISKIELFGKHDNAEILKILLRNKAGKSVFENFVDSIMQIVAYAEEAVISNRLFEESVVRAIYLYVDREWNECRSSTGKSWDKSLNQVLCKGLDLYNSKYNTHIMTTPFTYSLSLIVNR